MERKATTAIILDTRRKKKDEKYPIKIRVTFDQKYKKYGTKYDLTDNEYQTINSKGFRSERLRNIKIALDKRKAEADEIINNMDEFSFDEFENLFLEKRGDMTNIINAFDAIVVQKVKLGRISTSIGYEYAKKSLQEFEKFQLNLRDEDEVKTLPFKKITVNYLEEYDRWMRLKGKSITTIGMYLRNVRALVNTAVKTNVIKASAYPFGVGKYEIPTSDSIKKALTNDELKKLFAYQPTDGSAEHFYYDLWLFSYLSNGMNIKDILRLKYIDIQGESVIFVRSKTEHTTKKRTEIEAILTPISRQIIDRWGTKPIVADNFIFPFLNKEMTADKQHKVKEQAVWQINKYIKRIATKVGIDAKMTTYVARHSYTSKLLREGISIEFLRQQLGHTDSKTTLNYAQKIDFKTKKEASNLLTDF